MSVGAVDHLSECSERVLGCDSALPPSHPNLVRILIRFKTLPFFFGKRAEWEWFSEIEGSFVVDVGAVSKDMKTKDFDWWIAKYYQEIVQNFELLMRTYGSRDQSLQKRYLISS